MLSRVWKVNVLSMQQPPQHWLLAEQDGPESSGPFGKPHVPSPQQVVSASVQVVRVVHCPPAHTPSTQLTSLSSPEQSMGTKLQPLSALQESTVHGLKSLQTIGVLTHWAFAKLQVSVVHALLSLHCESDVQPHDARH